MMNTTLSVPKSLLLLIVLLLGACAPAPQGPALAATINRDCGPADGPAFTLSIPIEGRGTIVISIWQAPEIAGRLAFTLTDPTDATGSATLFTGPDSLQALAGQVTFDGIAAERPVQGSLRLASASGETFEGRFTAQWIDFPAYCG